MSRLVGPDSRYFEIVPHAEVRGENVLAEFVYSVSERGWVRRAAAKSVPGSSLEEAQPLSSFSVLSQVYTEEKAPTFETASLLLRPVA